jgi:site-specific recombinase XerD
MARLHCGSELRLLESIRLRVQDLDFEMNRICVIDNKGGKNRETLMPGSAKTVLHQPVVVK